MDNYPRIFPGLSFTQYQEHCRVATSSLFAALRKFRLGKMLQSNKSFLGDA